MLAILPTPIDPSAHLSKDEAAYRLYLQALEDVGLVLWWAHQPWTLRLGRMDFAESGRSVRYTPDFARLDPSGIMTLVEVKAGVKQGGKLVTVGRQKRRVGAVTIPRFADSEARSKLRLAVAMHPVRVVVTWKRSAEEINNGVPVWGEEEI